MVPEAAAIFREGRLIGLRPRGVDDAVRLGHRVLANGVAPALQRQDRGTVDLVQTPFVDRNAGRYRLTVFVGGHIRFP